MKDYFLFERQQNVFLLMVGWILMGFDNSHIISSIILVIIFMTFFWLCMEEILINTMLCDDF
jgi:hypothetical protein